MNRSITFSQSLEESDYGFIVDGITGRLKGVWVPDNKNDDPLPPAIIAIMNNCFGVSPDESETIH